MHAGNVNKLFVPSSALVLVKSHSTLSHPAFTEVCSNASSVDAFQDLLIL